MFKILKEIIKTGNATVAYPFEPISQAKDVRGKPAHDAKHCMACAACAMACPPNAIQMPVDLSRGIITWHIDYGRCIFCGRCEETCPTKALRLSDEFELAVMSKADLQERCVYQLQACDVCGEYFAPRKELDYVRRLLERANGEGAAGELVGVCLDCKRMREGAAVQNQAEKGGNHG